VTDAVRVWRVRKDHTWIDARIREAAEPEGVELQFFYDGALVVARRWPSREAAIIEADAHLRDLQRAGWNPHW
jgi:hypothetical protein